MDKLEQMVRPEQTAGPGWAGEAEQLQNLVVKHEDREQEDQYFLN